MDRADDEGPLVSDPEPIQFGAQRMLTHLLVYTWPYNLGFWGVFLWAFSPEWRIFSRTQEPFTSAQDASSKRLIGLGQGLALVAAFTIAAQVPSAALPHSRWWFWAGLSGIIGGSLLRRHCWRMLGANFTGAVIVKPDQEVIDRGAYRYVRHPSYTAGAIMFLGIGLALANWISVAVLLGAVSIVYGYRVLVEERALVATLGDPYRRYMGRTKRFVPFLF
jgi:protein-S-isoprenylcysteine O-methyltransferase Ste14